MAKKKNEYQKPMTPEMVNMANQKIFEFLQEQKFSSIEEMQKFVDQHITGHKIDEIFALKKGKKSNKDKSDDLLYQAYDSDPKTGMKLAKQALELYPENVAALNYMALHSTNIKTALALYKKAIAMATEQLGAKHFEEVKGHFWMAPETRPYMTARFGYANCLVMLNREEEAVKEFESMMELNPNDNQGVRYNLSSVLLRMKKYNAYYDFYKKHCLDSSTINLFNYALFAFATQGNTPYSTNALRKADEANNFVLEYLCGFDEPDFYETDYYSPGDEREAILYLEMNSVAWIECEGAMEWVEKFLEEFEEEA